MTSEPSRRATRSRKDDERAIPSLIPARSRTSIVRTCPPSRGSPPASDTTNTNTPSAKSMFVSSVFAATWEQRPRKFQVGRVLSDPAWLERFSERDAEPELHHTRLVGEVAVVGRLAVERARFGERVRPVVRAIEQVEHVDDGRERARTNRDRLLHAHVDAMNRQSDEGVARDDRAVRTQPLGGHEVEADVAHVAAVPRRHPRAGTIEVEAAHLYAEGRAVDAVEDRAMPLVRRREAVAAVDVRRDRERVRCTSQ